MARRDAAIAEALVRAYAITVASMVDGPRGFVGETYVVQAGDGRRLFVKVLPPGVDVAAIAGGAAVLEELHALGIDAVSRPVRTRDGRLTAEIDGRTLIVFDLIEGRAGGVRDWEFTPASFDYDFDEYVALPARIHRATPRVRSAMPREDFGLPFAGRHERLIGRALGEPGATPVRVGLRRLMQRHREQMAADWEELVSLGRACRAARWTPVITHGDGIGDNVIVGHDGRLHLVDWDEVMLAPAERDTWFFLCNPVSAAAFLERYRRVVADYRPDGMMRRFYLVRRFFEDLTGYLQHIVDGASDERERWNFGELEETCFRWLWPAMRRAGGDLG